MIAAYFIAASRNIIITCSRGDLELGLLYISWGNEKGGRAGIGSIWYLILCTICTATLSGWMRWMREKRGFSAICLAKKFLISQPQVLHGQD